MSRLASVFLVIAMVCLVVSTGPVHALVDNNVQPQLVKKIIPSGYAAGSLSFSSGIWTATNASGEVIQLTAGGWQGQGFNATLPVWTPRGIACYDSSGYPAIWNGIILQRTTENAQFSSPFMKPTSSSSGDIAYAKMSTHFLLVTRPNGSVDGYMPFSSLGWPGSWWTVSAAFTPGGTMYVAGQNTAVYQNYGYRVVGRYAGSFFDTGMAYSEITYGGGMLYGVSYDHRTVEAWSLYPTGSVKQKFTVVQGGYYNLLGGDANGAMFTDVSGIWYSTVPEPSSLLALGTGLIALGGGFIRRRK